MKAWQYIANNQPIALKEVEEPVAAPGEVVLDVRAAGICHTDVSFLDGTMSDYLARSPLTLGHEIAGVVCEVGDGVDGITIGDRVAIRADPRGPGCGRDGGFQPRVAVQAEFVVAVPDAVPWDQAAVSTDAGGTAYRAVMHRGAVKANDKVGIIGFGGLGSLGAQIAQLAGASVYAAETNLGLHAAILDSGASAVSTDIRDFDRAELDVIVDFAGFGTTTAAAIEAVRPGGRVIQVGLAKRTGPVDLVTLTMKEVELFGSMGGSNDDNMRVLELMAKGKLHCRTVQIRFEEIGESISRLQRGGVVGRFVAIYD